MSKVNVSYRTSRNLKMIAKRNVKTKPKAIEDGLKIAEKLSRVKLFEAVLRVNHGIDKSKHDNLVLDEKVVNRIDKLAKEIEEDRSDIVRYLIWVGSGLSKI